MANVPLYIFTFLTDSIENALQRARTLPKSEKQAEIIEKLNEALELSKDLMAEHLI